MKNFISNSAFTNGCFILSLLPLIFLSPVADSQTWSALSAKPLPLPLLAQGVPTTTNTSTGTANQSTTSLLQQQQQQQQPNLAIVNNNAYDRPLLLPVLVNSLLLRPLVTLNEQIVQSASALPQQLAQNGQVIGQALLVPIQQSTATGNALLAGLNNTLLSLALNGTLPPSATVAAVYQSLPTVPSPAQVMGQLNAALNTATMNAINASTSVVGSGLNSFGGSLANAGAGVQQLGGGVLSWAATMDRMRQQLAAGNYNITFGNSDNSSSTSTLTSTSMPADGTPATPALVNSSGNQSSEVITTSTP